MQTACNQVSGVGVDHIAQGVACHQSAHGDAAHTDGRGADAAFHGALHAKQFAYAGAAACADIALRRSLGEEGAKPKRVRFKALKSSRSASEVLAVCQGRSQPPKKSGGSFWAQVFEG